MEFTRSECSGDEKLRMERSLFKTANDKPVVAIIHNKQASLSMGCHSEYGSTFSTAMRMFGIYLYTLEEEDYIPVVIDSCPKSQKEINENNFGAFRINSTVLSKEETNAFACAQYRYHQEMGEIYEGHRFIICSPSFALRNMIYFSAVILELDPINPSSIPFSWTSFLFNKIAPITIPVVFSVPGEYANLSWVSGDKRSNYIDTIKTEDIALNWKTNFLQPSLATWADIASRVEVMLCMLDRRDEMNYNRIFSTLPNFSGNKKRRGAVDLTNNPPKNMIIKKKHHNHNHGEYRVGN